MALGKNVELSGYGGARVVRPVPVERSGSGDAAPESYRRPFALWGGFDASNPSRIEANKPVEVRSGGAPFTRVTIIIRTAQIAFVAFDRQVSDQPGGYDDIQTGQSRYEERCEPSTSVWLLFPVVPPDPVLVILYAGEQALPI